MLKNRTVEMRVVKAGQAPEAKPVDHYALAVVTAEKVVECGVLLLGVYIAADTLRQVIVHAAQVRIK